MMSKNNTTNLAFCAFAGNLLSSLVNHGAISKGAAMSIANEVSSTLGDDADAKLIKEYFQIAADLIERGA